MKQDTQEQPLKNGGNSDPGFQYACGRRDTLTELFALIAATGEKSALVYVAKKLIEENPQSNYILAKEYIRRNTSITVSGRQEIL